MEITCSFGIAPFNLNVILILYTPCIMFTFVLPSLSQHLTRYIAYTNPRCFTKTQTRFGALFLHVHLLNCYLLNTSNGFKHLSDSVLRKCGFQSQYTISETSCWSRHTIYEISCWSRHTISETSCWSRYTIYETSWWSR